MTRGVFARVVGVDYNNVRVVDVFGEPIGGYQYARVYISAFVGRKNLVSHHRVPSVNTVRFDCTASDAWGILLAHISRLMDNEKLAGLKNCDSTH